MTDRTESYKSALAALTSNPAVLLDLDQDIFFGTTPMEHLELLLQFMNCQGENRGDLSQPTGGEVSVKSIPQAYNVTGGFPNFGDISAGQNIRNSFRDSMEASSKILPIYFSLNKRARRTKLTKSLTTNQLIWQKLNIANGGVRPIDSYQQEQGLGSVELVKREFKTTKESCLKRYACIHCSKKFKQKCHLNRHQRRHSGVKRYFCILCYHGFFQRSNLRVHMRTHSSDSTVSHIFVCTFCNKRFTRKHSLNKHLIKHTNKFPKISIRP
jgi:uncharacterized Zn-finger protein